MNDIRDLEQIYCSQYAMVPLSILLKELEERYCGSRPVKAPPKTKTKVLKPDHIMPDRNYVIKLLKMVEQLKNHIEGIKYELGKAYDNLEKVIDSDDFDDPEDVMNAVHETIRKYIYESDSKVNNSDWAELEQFLILAGYKPVKVEAGDDIYPFRTYFNQPIAAEGGTQGTIKSIQLKPFELSYYNGDDVEKLKLCGKCTYYR